MKKYIVLCFCFISFSLYSQEKYQSFIDEITEIYHHKRPKFQKESEKTMKGYWKKTKNDSIRPKYDYLFIPEILLKKSKKLYQNIDSTNLVQYFNPKSMYYHQTLVSVDSAYVGDIRAWGSKVGVNDYDPKPKVDDFVYEILYKNLLEIKPDVVFQVRNGGYFFIRQNKLFALFPLYEPVVYPIDEYTEKFKDDIFFLFGYEPREEPIIAY